MEREKEQMMREKEELMLRLQDYEQKTKKAEKGGCTHASDFVSRRTFHRGTGGQQHAHTHTHTQEEGPSQFKTQHPG